MVYLLKAVIQHPGHERREITVTLWGCTDPAHAEAKLRALYPVVKVKTTTEVPPKR